jgi:signal transduction histidine kinase
LTGLLGSLAPAAWLRMPRPTARLRLALLYGALFLVSGTALLTVTYLLFQQATSSFTLVSGNQLEFGNMAMIGAIPPAPRTSPAAGGATIAGGTGYGPKLTPAQQANQQKQAAKLQAEIAQLHALDRHDLLTRSGIALGLTAILSVALGWFVAGRVLAPVRTISATARQISARNLNERLALDGPDDEFRELAATLDDLLERLEAAFDSQRRFVASASHELRTPLTLDRVLLERALRHPSPTGALWRTTCERLLASSQQQDRLIDALLTLARSEGGPRSFGPVELPAVIDAVLLSPELDAGAMDLSVLAETGPALVSGDPHLVERLVRNLVDNAIRYNQPSGQVDITAGTADGRAVLTIANTGPEVPAADVDRLFQPFQRLAPGRLASGQDGSGLGLSIVKAIADAHEATVGAKPLPGGGLRIEVRFPPGCR